MAFQIVQRVTGNQLKATPYLQLSVRTAASKSVIFMWSFVLFSLWIKSVLCTLRRLLYNIVFCTISSNDRENGQKYKNHLWILNYKQQRIQRKCKKLWFFEIKMIYWLISTNIVRQPVITSSIDIMKSIFYFSPLSQCTVTN